MQRTVIKLKGDICRFLILEAAMFIFYKQEIFNAASKLLYTSTHRRAYFKSVKIVIPRTWSNVGSYRIVSALISSTIHIKIGNHASILPVTVGSEKCGKEGIYTYLHYEAFVLRQDTTLWGKHGKFINSAATRC